MLRRRPPCCVPRPSPPGSTGVQSAPPCLDPVDDTTLTQTRAPGEPPVIKRISARGAEYTHVDDRRLSVTSPGNHVLEPRLRERLTDWQSLLQRQPVEARQMLRRLFGPGARVLTEREQERAVLRAQSAVDLSTPVRRGVIEAMVAPTGSVWWWATSYSSRCVASPSGLSTVCLLHTAERPGVHRARAGRPQSHSLALGPMGARSSRPHR